MPFITQDRRNIIKEKGLHGLGEVMTGDLCYIYYLDMVEKWKENPRWNTAHEIYSDVERHKLLGIDKLSIAENLAWQVFFQLHVMPYELQKRKENGDV